MWQSVLVVFVTACLKLHSPNTSLRISVALFCALFCVFVLFVWGAYCRLRNCKLFHIVFSSCFPPFFMYSHTHCVLCIFLPFPQLISIGGLSVLPSLHTPIMWLWVARHIFCHQLLQTYAFPQSLYAYPILISSPFSSLSPSVDPDSRPHVVAMTANSTPEDRAACFNAGMCDFILKPFNAKDVRKCIAKWCLTPLERGQGQRGGRNSEAKKEKTTTYSI